MNKKSLIALVLLVVTLFVFQGFGGKQSGRPALEQFINLPGLDASRPAWKVLSQDLGSERGHVRLHQSKWLMFYL